MLLLASDPDVGQLIQRELRNRGVSIYVLQRRVDDDLTVCIRSEHPLLLIIDPSLKIDTVAWCETARATDPMLSVLLLESLLPPSEEASSSSLGTPPPDPIG